MSLRSTLRSFVPALLLAGSIALLPFASLAAPAEPAAPPPAVPAIPDTPAGRRLAAYLEAFNSGDDARLQAYIEREFAASALAQRPLADRMAAQRRVRGDQGSLQLQSAEARGEASVVAVVRGARGGEVIRLTLDCEPKEPFGVLGMRLERGSGGREGPGPAAGDGPPLSEAEAVQALDAAVRKRVADDAFSGTVLAVRGGKTIYGQAFGLADREKKLPNRTDTKFNLGSINKLFTRIAIARLAQDGKLKLSDTLIQHLPDYPNRAIAEQVTLEQLLDHRSGLGDIFGERYDKAPHTLRSLKDFLPLFADQPLLFAPGSSERYSNAGYIVLGLVIEKESGRSYYDAIQRWIYDPAGMKDSGSFAFDATVPNRAVGYHRAEGAAPSTWQPNTVSLPGRGSSAGGGYSTAPDLLRFATALRESKLLSKGWTAWVLGGPEPAPKAPNAANTEAHGGMGVAGGAPGINAALEIDLERDVILIVLGNYDPPAAEGVAREARSILMRIRS